MAKTIEQYTTSDELTVSIPVTDSSGNLLDNAGKYSIYRITNMDTDASVLVYTGKVYADGHAGVADDTVDIDIMPVIRNTVSPYVQLLDDNFANADYADSSISFYQSNVYKVSSDTSTYYAVKYDYSEYISSDYGYNSTLVDGYSHLLNSFNGDHVYAGMMVNMTNFVSRQHFSSDTNDAIRFKMIYYYPDKTTYMVNYGLQRFASWVNWFTPVMRQYNNMYPVGVEFIVEGVKADSIVYQESSGYKRLLDCMDTGTCVLYYVNERGAVDYVICDMVNKTTVNATRNQITKYCTKAQPAKRGLFSYSTQVYESYELNTDVMTDIESENMKGLMQSNYTWMWYFNGMRWVLQAVELTDTSMVVKKFKTHKIYNYTFKCRQSITKTIQ